MDILSHEQIESFLNQRLKHILETSGFVQEEKYFHAFRYSTNDRTDVITYTGIKIYHQFFYTKPTLHRYINSVENYWIDMANQINIQVGPYFDTLCLQPIILKPDIVNASNYDKVYNGYQSVANQDGIDEFIKVATDVIDNLLFPYAKKYLDLREIDKFVNAEVKYRDNVQGFLGTDGTQFKRIIIAKLVGNPIYDELVSTYRGYYDWYTNKAKEPDSEHWGNYPKVFETLFERLKDVKPLENPIIN